MPTIAVTALAPELEAIAQRLARDLNLPHVRPDAAGYDWQLRVTPHDAPPGHRLELQQIGDHAPGPIVVDFVGGAVGHRRRTGEGRHQPLARAVGLKRGVNPTVLDATGGLGRDAFVLATLGCAVTLVERHPVIAVLLEDGLQRARADAETAPIAARMTLRHADTRAVFDALEEADRPDVIYLDPMYPHRSKTAAVKKEMRALQALLGEDEDADELLALARHCARQRVVVKRPKGAAELGNQAPHHCIVAPHTRYDVYLPEPPTVAPAAPSERV
jgi:16S rRNA (guanine1516-N2)-methyltransferase